MALRIAWGALLILFGLGMGYSLRLQHEGNALRACIHNFCEYSVTLPMRGRTLAYLEMCRDEDTEARAKHQMGRNNEEQ